MEAIVSKSVISGKIQAPPSKSAFQRAMAAALIRKGHSTIHNTGLSADDRAAISIAMQLGARVAEQGNKMEVDSEGVQPVSGTVHAGESGLASRLFASIAALASAEITITGEGSLLNRPFDFYEKVLPALGVQIATKNGKLPLIIKGPLMPADITIDGSLSSQFLSGLLMAYSAADASGVTIEVKDLKSRPYIDLTLGIMEHFKLKTPAREAYRYFRFGGTNAAYRGNITYTVEGDWSGAAFILVAGAVAGEVELEGLDVFSLQADKSILQVLMQAGAGLSIEEKKVTVRKAPLKAFHFDATHAPDLFPPLVVLAAFCSGTSVIEGVDRLRHKESDRAMALLEEMQKIGISIRLQDNLMIVDGNSTIVGSVVESHNDHRIAMALAVAGLGSESSIRIRNAEVVSKSYPAFFHDLQKLGAALSLEP